MPDVEEHVAILRCQTWNVWPDLTVIEQRVFEVHYGVASPIPARLAILCYDKRSSAERYISELTSRGPLLWDGQTPGLYCVRDTVLKAPEDVVQVSWQHRHAQKGEVDICINFKFAGDIPQPLVQALRASAFAILSLINLELEDFLTPALPFQIRKILPDGRGQMESTVVMAVRRRSVLDREALASTLSKLSQALLRSSFGPKLRVALELYAAHFAEEQVRVRFLLLVIAIESLATPVPKHQVAIDLLRRWQSELEVETSKYRHSSEEFYALDAIRRELDFRVDDSIRSQFRRLFVVLPGQTAEQANALERRAILVYDKRSKLVHDGHLPDDELVALESEARELLEKILVAAIANPTYNRQHESS